MYIEFTRIAMDLLDVFFLSMLVEYASAANIPLFWFKMFIAFQYAS